MAFSFHVLSLLLCESALEGPATLSIARHLGVPYNQRHYAFAAYCPRPEAVMSNQSKQPRNVRP